ncbi:NAD(P)-dependent dehydrogenase (short-subunit alcohol dehydrogenase family) [Kibdelosporangium banguiense]|uniref:NAD(P)-dependent dehydrogenase (Short-subunit alcohol dehydrogenase family) n=1 Tax=Kibdelosporangium banguiense TaxID=1365924 RepID=A0ABS4TY92_9PSEU|nr:SDR family NAD(P)-dependent oxidoreductase [Kibdelosporangium banguiense]MBP2329372.1 NAD(P)-dependent dehydrogenase (short-subunit alcohol dehydrogenase family) [Kibdelosporangium banguiense]
MTNLRFDDKVAIVTGAGGGLGKHHALLLASRGAKVIVNDIGGSLSGDGSDAAPAVAVAREIRELGGDAVANTSNVATPEGGEALVNAALSTYGRVDILVNNAGILRDALFEDVTPELLDPVLDVHVKALFHVTRPAWHAMRKQGYGRVVNTTSAVGLLGGTNKSNYGAAKGAVAGLTRVLAMEGAEHNIKVNAIAPIAATRMLTHSLRDADDGSGPRLAPATMAMMNAVVDKLDPALVSPVVAFLAHEDCPVTGEIYTAGAGQVARFFTGRTEGYYHPQLSIEDVRDHLSEIRDETGYTIPANPGEEMAQLLRTIAAQPQLVTE